MDSLAQKAIDEALVGNWQSAAKINEEILETSPENREALNRLARAYLELGKVKKAVTFYKKVLKIDPYNTIAQKALVRLKAVQDNPKLQKLVPSSTRVAGANLFIEEPGKTKTVNLIHLGDPPIISVLDTGEQVKLTPRSHRVSVETETGHYIGRLTDDLSRRIIKFTRAGNVYSCFIRAVSPETVCVFIRETHRTPNLSDVPSFPVLEKSGYISFTPPDLIHEERPNVSAGEEELF